MAAPIPASTPVVAAASSSWNETVSAAFSSVGSTFSSVSTWCLAKVQQVLPEALNNLVQSHGPFAAVVALDLGLLKKLYTNVSNYNEITKKLAADPQNASLLAQKSTCVKHGVATAALLAVVSAKAYATYYGAPLFSAHPFCNSATHLHPTTSVPKTEL